MTAKSDNIRAVLPGLGHAVSRHGGVIGIQEASHLLCRHVCWLPHGCRTASMPPPDQPGLATCDEAHPAALLFCCAGVLARTILVVASSPPAPSKQPHSICQDRCLLPAPHCCEEAWESTPAGQCQLKAWRLSIVALSCSAGVIFSSNLLYRVVPCICICCAVSVWIPWGS